MREAVTAGHSGHLSPWALPGAGKPAVICQEEKSCCYLKIMIINAIIIITVIVINNNSLLYFLEFYLDFYHLVFLVKRRSAG